MAHFNTSSSSVPDASYKYSLRQKQCALSSVAVKIAAFERNLSGVSNTTSSTHALKPHLERRSTVVLSTKPLHALKPAETQSDDSSGSSLPSHLKNKPNYIRGARNKLQIGSVDPSVTKKKLPTVLALGSPPTKPKRPPRVDIHRFRRNLKCLNKGPGIRMPPSAVPSHPHPSPSFNHAAALSQQLNMDESYENVGIKKPPPLPLQEHPSRRTKVDLSNDRMERAEKSKKHQKSKCGKDDANHGKVTKKKEAEPKVTINPKEIKGHERTAKKEKKKKFKIKGPIHTIKKGKALDCKGGKSDLSLNQAEITEVVQNPDVSVMTEAVTTGLDDLNVNKETEPWMHCSEADIYDDVGVDGEDDLYVAVDYQDTR